MQTTEFIIAIAHLLSKQEENKQWIGGMVKYVLRGFTDTKLTLAVSSYCFHILCKENPAFIAPFALELV